MQKQAANFEMSITHMRMFCQKGKNAMTMTANNDDAQ